MNENENPIEIMTCYRHPDRETLLRCNKCLRPICLKCAVSTPTGYRCKECVQEQQKRFNTSLKRDYFIGGLVSALIGFLGSLLQNVLPLSSVLISVLMGFAAGTLIVNAVRFVTSRRRSSQLNRVVLFAAGMGAILPCIQDALNIFRFLFLGRFSTLIYGAFSLQWSIFYIVSLCASVWANQRGIVTRR